DERNVNMDTASQVDDGIERGEEPMEQEDTAQPAVEKLPPFTKLKARGRKLLRWIPPVKFFGMGEDGYYSIHIEHDCMKKTTRFIEKNIPGYTFHFVPFGQDESIHLLFCPEPGSPIHGTLKTCPTECIKPHGTIGGIVALLDSNGKKELYALTANHVIEYCKPCQEYISWTKQDQSDKIMIGRPTDVSFSIPLKMDDEKHVDQSICWKSDDTDQALADISSTFEKYWDDVKEQDQEQYDIACIKVDDHCDDIKKEFAPCDKCCLIECQEDKVKFSSTAEKLESATTRSNRCCGKILRTDAGGIITVGDKTAWVDNMTVICSVDDTDDQFIQEGDSGSIMVCGNKDDEEGHRQNCYMVFAGLKNANKKSWNCSSASFAFSLDRAIKKLQEQLKEGQRLQLSCCKQAKNVNIGRQDSQTSFDVKEEKNEESTCAISKSGTRGIKVSPKNDLKSM
ncbi:unnamed protein product, partial [Owenia fusiformis]